MLKLVGKMLGLVSNEVKIKVSATEEFTFCDFKFRDALRLL